MSDTHDAFLVAAAGASGTAPTDPVGRAQWLAGVADLAVDLYRQSPKVAAEIDILAACRPITGIIRSVHDQSNRAVIAIEATMGDREEGKTEDLRTPWLNEPRGAALASLARALIGQECRFGKGVEEIDGGRKKVRMVAWIEPIDHADAPTVAAAPAERPAERPATSDVGARTTGTSAHTSDTSARTSAGTSEATPTPAAPRRELTERQLAHLAPPRDVEELKSYGRDYLGFDEHLITTIARDVLGEMEAGNHSVRDHMARAWKALLARRDNFERFRNNAERQAS